MMVVKPKFKNWKKKVADDLESFKLFKERIQIEVELHKDRGAHPLRLSAIDGLSNLQTSAVLGRNDDVIANSKLEVLTKGNEKFQKMTMANIAELKSIVDTLQKKLRNTDKSGGNRSRPGSPDPKSQRFVGSGNVKQETAEHLAKLEDLVYDNELQLKNLVFDTKKDLADKIDHLTSNLESIKANGVQGPTNLRDSSMIRPADRSYEEFMAIEKRKDIEDMVKNFRKEIENKYAALRTDVNYLNEAQKYMGVVGTSD